MKHEDRGQAHTAEASNDFARAFASGLTDPSAPPPAQLIAAAGKGVTKRYNVYRNNVTVSRIDTVAAIYPAVQRITGSEIFRAMARFWISKVT